MAMAGKLNIYLICLIRGKKPCHLPLEIPFSIESLDWRFSLPRFPLDFCSKVNSLSIDSWYQSVKSVWL